jgi:hypothetical protein
MKQLELDVIIKQSINKYELYARPKNNNDSKLITYCTGNTYDQVLNGFYDALSNHNAKYWFLLQDY